MDSESNIGKWIPSRNAKCGVVIHNYNGETNDDRFLKLQFGDVVQILEENSGWYRGFALKDKPIHGIFPASYIHLKDVTVINPGPSEVIKSKEDPMVQEVSDVLREWCGNWKKLYA